MVRCYAAFIDMFPWKLSEFPSYKIWICSDTVDARTFRQGWARCCDAERDYYRRQMETGVVNGTRAAVERDRLQDAVRNLRDVKGRHHTQLAVERLIALLPENA